MIFKNAELLLEGGFRRADFRTENEIGKSVV